MTKEIKLENYENMIRKVCWKMIKYYKSEILEFDDLYNEGVIIFYNSLEDFDESKASFSNHLYTNLYGFLKLYISKQFRSIENCDNFHTGYEADPSLKSRSKDKYFVYIENEYEDERQRFERVIDLYESSRSLSAHAKVALELILNGEISRYSQRIGVNTFVRAFDWTYTKAKRVYQELELFYKEFNTDCEVLTLAV